MSRTATITSAVAEAQRDLDDLRDRISDLQAERQEIAAAPVDREEAERRVDGLIAAARARQVLDLPQLFSAQQAPLSPYLPRRLGEDPLALMAAVCPDRLRAALLEHLPPDGLSIDGRLAKLAELDRAIAAASVAEECCIREIERALGTSVARRADVDPQLLLAPDEELEAPDDGDDPEPDDAGSKSKEGH